MLTVGAFKGFDVGFDVMDIGLDFDNTIFKSVEAGMHLIEISLNGNCPGFKGSVEGRFEGALEGLIEGGAKGLAEGLIEGSVEETLKIVVEDLSGFFANDVPKIVKGEVYGGHAHLLVWFKYSG
jgi:hypothetical protein